MTGSLGRERKSKAQQTKKKEGPSALPKFILKVIPHQIAERCSSTAARPAGDTPNGELDERPAWWPCVCLRVQTESGLATFK
jgi:hypothetical protein